MTVQQLFYVIKIAETGSLNKASEVLYVAQPSLTGSVRELEKEIGISIFHRTGKGVRLTAEGEEFIQYARSVVDHYQDLLERYSGKGTYKKKFGISTQHYSFAVKSFVEMVKKYNTEEYEFAVRETKTMEVIEDVSTGKSEIGVLYQSDFNRVAIVKALKGNHLEFFKLTECDPYVYLWKGHPLAQEKSICFSQLSPYPCLAFEQGGTGSFYFAEEILSNEEYPRIIRANDRATMLNLMVGLCGYTLCSGIISEELNGTDYVAVPFQPEHEKQTVKMEIGYITRKNSSLSNPARLYIEELKKYLGI